MEDSNWIKSAIRFVLVVVVIGAILFGGIYLLKHRDNSTSQNTPSKVSQSGSNKNKKSSAKQESAKKSSKDSKKSNQKSASESSPQNVAPAGVSDYWYVPILGAAVLGFTGYEYYLSRQSLKRATSNR